MMNKLLVFIFTNNIFTLIVLTSLVQVLTKSCYAKLEFLFSFLHPFSTYSTTPIQGFQKPQNLPKE